MAITDFLSGSKFGTVGGLASIFGGVWAVGVSPDNLPVVGGIGLGLAGLGWSSYLSGRDRRVATLTDEIELLQTILRAARADLASCGEITKALGVENAKLAARLAAREARDDPK